jgi:hypothetical protein
MYPKMVNSADSEGIFVRISGSGGNPVKYADPDRKATTVVIIHASTWYDTIAGGSHTALHMSNPLSDKKASLHDPEVRV